MLLSEIISRRTLLKFIIYLFGLYVTVILQLMLLASVKVFGAGLMIVPMYIAAIGLFEGGVWGGIFGILAGMMTDIGYSDSTVMFLFLFTIVGFFVGYFAGFFINRRFYSFMILALLAGLFVAAFRMISPWIFKSGSFGEVFSIAIKQAVFSIIYAVPSYFFAGAVSRRLSGGSGDDKEDSDDE
ncbi:MAG: hypothetical protein MJ067_05210 [Oscillospiraceae bacterium]|nr:hypothetical protein [Oscillospiraceae bacterium]